MCMKTRDNKKKTGETLSLSLFSLVYARSKVIGAGVFDQHAEENEGM